MSNISELKVIQGGKKPDESRSCLNCDHCTKPLFQEHFCVRGMQSCVYEIQVDESQPTCGPNLSHWSPKIEHEPMWLRALRVIFGTGRTDL